MTPPEHSKPPMKTLPPFTAGPWRLRPHIGGGLMLFPDDNSCAWMAILPSATENDRADAALISAAPELFECLAHLMERDWFNNPDFTGTSPDAEVICGLDFRKVKAALKKATTLP